MRTVRGVWRVAKAIVVAKLATRASAVLDASWRGPDDRWIRGAPLREIFNGRMAAVHARRTAVSAFRDLVFPEDA